MTHPLRQQLEHKRDELIESWYGMRTSKDRSREGFNACLELLWPCVEAACALDAEVTRALKEAQITNRQSFVNIKLDCMGIHDALAELKEKLEGK
jgi:hypothetical protein